MKHFKTYAIAIAVAAAGALAVNMATAQSRIDRTGAAPPPKRNDCLRKFKKDYLRPASKAYTCRGEFEPSCRNGTVLKSVKVEKTDSGYEIVYVCEDPSQE